MFIQQTQRKKKRNKVCNITILAGLSLVALGAEACAVADADASVVALRVALRLRVKHEADRDSPRCVRAPGGAQGDGGGQQHGRREAHDAHVVCKGERETERGESSRRAVRSTEMEEKVAGLRSPPPKAVDQRREPRRGGARRRPGPADLDDLDGW